MYDVYMMSSHRAYSLNADQTVLGLVVSGSRSNTCACGWGQVRMGMHDALAVCPPEWPGFVTGLKQCAEAAALNYSGADCSAFELSKTYMLFSFFLFIRIAPRR